MASRQVIVADLVAAFDRVAAQAHAGLRVVVGAPRSGRTRIVSELDRALSTRRHGPRIVRLGFGPDGIIEDGYSPGSGHELAEWAQRASDVAKVAGPVVSTPADVVAGAVSALTEASIAVKRRNYNLPLAEQETLRSRVARELGRGPVLVVLDDLDDAELCTVWASVIVPQLLNEFRTHQLCVVLTAKSAPLTEDPNGIASSALSRLVTRARGDIDTDVLPVPAMTVADVRDLIPDLSWSMATELHHVAAGDVSRALAYWLLWRERHVVRRDAEEIWQGTIPFDQRAGAATELIGQRLGELLSARSEPDALALALRLLAVGALQGRRFTARPVIETVGCDYDDAIDLLDDIAENLPGLLAEAEPLQLADTLWCYELPDRLTWLALSMLVLMPAERIEFSAALADRLLSTIGAPAWMEPTLARLYREGDRLLEYRRHQRAAETYVDTTVALDFARNVRAMIHGKPDTETALWTVDVFINSAQHTKDPQAIEFLLRAALDLAWEATLPGRWAWCAAALAQEVVERDRRRALALAGQVTPQVLAQLSPIGRLPVVIMLAAAYRLAEDAPAAAAQYASLESLAAKLGNEPVRQLARWYQLLVAAPDTAELQAQTMRIASQLDAWESALTIAQWSKIAERCTDDRVALGIADRMLTRCRRDPRSAPIGDALHHLYEVRIRSYGRWRDWPNFVNAIITAVQDGLASGDEGLVGVGWLGFRGKDFVDAHRSLGELSTTVKSYVMAGAVLRLKSLAPELDERAPAPSYLPRGMPSLADILDMAVGADTTGQGAATTRQRLARLRRDGGLPILLELRDAIATQDVAGA